MQWDLPLRPRPALCGTRVIRQTPRVRTLLTAELLRGSWQWRSDGLLQRDSLRERLIGRLQVSDLRVIDALLRG
jgi:hypothetical protein